METRKYGIGAFSKASAKGPIRAACSGAPHPESWLQTQLLHILVMWSWQSHLPSLASVSSPMKWA